MADEVSLLETFADLAELTRNRPVDEDRQSELRVHSSREHFHTYLQSLDVERGGLPEQFRERLVRVLAALRRRGRRPHARAGGRGLPHLPGPAADDARGRARLRPAGLLEPRDPADRRAGRAGRARCWSASVASRSRATRRSATWPAASGSAGSTSRRWTRSARTSSSASATRSRRSRPTSRRPASTAPDASTRWPPSPSRSCGFLAERLEQGIPAREPMLEVLARRHYREYELHDLQSFDSTCARPWSRATPSTSDRPGWSPRSARWRSWSTAPSSSPR